MTDKAKKDQANQSPKEAQQGDTPPPKKTFLSEISSRLKWAIGTAVVIVAGLIIVAILSAIPSCKSHSFSSQITSKEVQIEIANETGQEQLTITDHPFLRKLIISADHLNMTTSEIFMIKETNEPELRKSKEPNTLRASSKVRTDYQIQNLTERRIPTRIVFQPKKPNALMKFIWEERPQAGDNSVVLSLPAGQTTLKLTTKEVWLLIHKANIEHGTIKTEPKDRRIEIRGEPYWVNIKAKSSENTDITIRYKKGEACELTIDTDTPHPITNVQFIKADSESKIYPEGEEPLTLKDRFPPNPDIQIPGKIEKPREFHLTDTGINTYMKGESRKIQIAGTPLYTVWSEITRILRTIPEPILEKFK